MVPCRWRCILGVLPDVYSTCSHKLLSHGNSAERVLWMLSVIYARLRHAAAAAAAEAGAAGGDGTTAGGVKQWRAPDKVRACRMMAGGLHHQHQ